MKSYRLHIIAIFYEIIVAVTTAGLQHTLPPCHFSYSTKICLKLLFTKTAFDSVFAVN